MGAEVFRIIYTFGGPYYGNHISNSSDDYTEPTIKASAARALRPTSGSVFPCPRQSRFSKHKEVTSGLVAPKKDRIEALHFAHSAAMLLSRFVGHFSAPPVRFIGMPSCCSRQVP